jgi:hypothetical protein
MLHSPSQRGQNIFKKFKFDGLIIVCFTVFIRKFTITVKKTTEISNKPKHTKTSDLIKSGRHPTQVIGTWNRRQGVVIYSRIHTHKRNCRIR